MGKFTSSESFIYDSYYQSSNSTLENRRWDGVIESKVPVKNRGEDAFHGLLVKRLNADDIQVAQKARGHHVATSSRRSHRTQHQDILQFQNTCVLSVRKKDMHVMLKTLWRCLRQLWGELRRYLCHCRAGCCLTADAITS